MKLITDFKDYYDGIAHGVMNDPFYRYERFQKIHELDINTSRYDIDINISQHRTGQYSSDVVRASFFILGFCGKIPIFLQTRFLVLIASHSFSK